MQYRRARTPGGRIFFTVVTHGRRRFLCEPVNIALLKSAFQSVMATHPFLVDAMVVLPDHIHCLWTLPVDDRDFSIRWRLIKTTFTRQCGARHKSLPSAARLAKKEQAVWQRRFWEHQIRDEEDFRRHVEYIHYNPVKHGLVAAPRDWPNSSFHRYVGKGSYDADWGASGPMYFADTVGNE